MTARIDRGQDAWSIGAVSKAWEDSGPHHGGLAASGRPDDEQSGRAQRGEPVEHPCDLGLPAEEHRGVVRSQPDESGKGRPVGIPGEGITRAQTQSGQVRDKQVHRGVHRRCIGQGLLFAQERVDGDGASGAARGFGGCRYLDDGTAAGDGDRHLRVAPLRSERVIAGEEDDDLGPVELGEQLLGPPGPGGDAALTVVVAEDVVAGAFEAGFERQRSRQVAVAVADEDASHVGGLRPNRDGEREALHVVEDVLRQGSGHELALVFGILRILHVNGCDVLGDARSNRVRR